MRRPIRLLIPILVFVAGCSSGPRVGARAPDFVTVDASGARMTSRELQGHVSVMYFWATWCAPCVQSSPAVQRVYDYFQGDDRVTVLGVHYNGVGEPLDFVARFGYRFTIVPDGSAIVAAYRVRKIPTIVVLDRDGRVLENRVGYADGDEREIIELVEAALGRFPGSGQ